MAAHEIAVQLRAAGEQVALIIMDTYPVDLVTRPQPGPADAARQARIRGRLHLPGATISDEEYERLARISLNNNQILLVPAAELAVTVHPGSLADVDRAYGTLAAYVATHALQVTGPIREHYLVSRQDTVDENAWRTEICWPIFSTGTAA